MPEAHGSSQARDRIHTVAVTAAAAATMPDPLPTAPPGNSLLIPFPLLERFKKNFKFTYGKMQRKSYNAFLFCVKLQQIVYMRFRIHTPSTKIYILLPTYKIKPCND